MSKRTTPLEIQETKALRDVIIMAAIKKPWR